LRAATDAATSGWALSGSLLKWGDSFIRHFNLVVFLRIDPEARMARLHERERRRYGALIEPGGAMHAQHLEFIEWARGYDDPAFTGRSLASHRAWLAGLPCPVIELDGAAALEDGVAAVLAVPLPLEGRG
jgi:hypothetical protein